jgi:hypothetical protein
MRRTLYKISYENNSVMIYSTDYRLSLLMQCYPDHRDLLLPLPPPPLLLLPLLPQYLLLCPLSMGTYTDTVHCQVYASRTTSSPRKTGRGTEREQKATCRMRRKGKEEWKELKSLERSRLKKRSRNGNKIDWKGVEI